MRHHIDQVNLKGQGERIYKAFTNLMFARYSDGQWGISVGYRTHPAEVVLMEKWLYDWQVDSDCGTQCTESLTQPVILAQAPVAGTLSSAIGNFNMQIQPEKCAHKPWRCHDRRHRWGLWDEQSFFN